MSCSPTAPGPLLLEDRAGLDEATRDELAAVVAAHRTLEDVVRWGLLRQPPAVIAEVVVQDEYTHDVIFQGATDGPAIVLDAT